MATLERLPMRELRQSLRDAIADMGHRDGCALETGKPCNCGWATVEDRAVEAVDVLIAFGMVEEDWPVECVT